MDWKLGTTLLETIVCVGSLSPFRFAGRGHYGILQSFVPKSDVPSIAVFNTLNWSYSGIAKAYVDHQILPKDKAFEIVDAAGNVIPAQAGESVPMVLIGTFT